MTWPEGQGPERRAYPMHPGVSGLSPPSRAQMGRPPGKRRSLWARPADRQEDRTIGSSPFPLNGPKPGPPPWPCAFLREVSSVWRPVEGFLALWKPLVHPVSGAAEDQLQGTGPQAQNSSGPSLLWLAQTSSSRSKSVLASNLATVAMETPDWRPASSSSRGCPRAQVAWGHVCGGQAW